MSPDLRKQVWAEMRATGDRLKGVLRADPRHPAGRNPYAHVAGCVKEEFGCSYGDLPDEKIGDVLDYLKKLEALEKTKPSKEF